MKEFSFSTRVFFGEGALGRLSKVSNRRVLIVTDKFMAESGVADRVASYLDNCEVTVFSDVVPDPTIEVVAAGVSCLQQCSAEVMIAVGGGSSIDAAKAIREVADRISTMDTRIMECFAIPTTSGTGSEVTEYAVISDAEKGIKYPLTSRAMRPPTAILDPSLVVSAPPTVTADSGMDVLAHAIEAYVATGANDFSDALAEKAASMVLRWLPVAYKDGGHMLAREKLHNASCLAGLAFNSAGLGLCHGISHALGGKLHMPHGRLNAIVLPHVIRYNAAMDKRAGDYSPTAKKYQKLAKRVHLPASSVAVGNSQLIHAVENLNKVLKIPSSLRVAKIDIDVYNEQVPDIIQAALNDGTTASNPRTPNEKDVKGILNLVRG